MAHYILIHGAWHGAWCWEKITPLLEAKGHRVSAPDLPAHGQDKTPPLHITFENYLECIEKILSVSPEPVILVGHSFSGMIISSLAERHPDKVKCLVYIAGYLPQNGQSMFDLASKQPPTRFVKMMRADIENNSFCFPANQMRGFAFHQCDEAISKRLESLFCDEPYQPLVTQVSLSEQRFGSIPRVYIECLQDKAILLQTQRLMHQATPCQVYALESDHSPFYSHLVGLSKILLGSALSDIFFS